MQVSKSGTATLCGQNLRDTLLSEHVNMKSQFNEELELNYRLCAKVHIKMIKMILTKFILLFLLVFVFAE